VEERGGRRCSDFQLLRKKGARGKKKKGGGGGLWRLPSRRKKKKEHRKESRKREKTFPSFPKNESRGKKIGGENTALPSSVAPTWGGQQIGGRNRKKKNRARRMKASRCLFSFYFGEGFS